MPAPAIKIISPFVNIEQKYKEDILKYTKYLLNSLKINKSLNIVLTNNSHITQLHRDYFGIDTPTDVISFHSYGIKNFLGEIVISIEYAKKVSKNRKIPLVEELARYITHGVLHILGYRDDKPKLRQVMWTKQENLIKRYYQKKI